MNTARLRQLFVFLTISFLLPTFSARAHIERGSMPDPVAEMEYRILLEFKPEDISTRALLGMALLRQGKLTEAEKEFRLIIKTSPDHFDALDGLGLVLIKQTRATEAADILKRAADLRPGDIMVHLHLGQALVLLSRPESARKALETGLNLLERQPTTPALEQQRREFQNALQGLPVKAGDNSTPKE